MNIYDKTMLHALAQPRKGLFMEIQKQKFMGICGSLMDIYDYPKREAQIKKCFTKSLDFTDYYTQLHTYGRI